MAKRYGKINNKNQKPKKLCKEHNVRMINTRNRYICPRCRALETQYIPTKGETKNEQQGNEELNKDEDLSEDNN